MIDKRTEKSSVGLSRRAFLSRISLASIIIPSMSVGKMLRSNNLPPQVGRPICIFSKHLQFLDYSDMAHAAAEIGFDGVDLTVRPGGHVLPENVERDLPRAVEAVRSAGLEVYMMTTKITDANDPLTHRILKTASKFNIGYYRMGYLSYKDSLGVDGSLQAYKPQFKGLEILNQKFNSHGAYQNHSGTRVGGPVWDLWVLLKDRNPNWSGVQYDIRHATAEGGNSWPLGFRLLGPWTKITAIKDFYWKKEEGEWRIHDCPLGEGMVDLDHYYSLYKELNVEGPISLHFEYDLPGEEYSLSERTARTIDIMKRDLQYLRGKLKNAGLS